MTQEELTAEEARRRLYEIMNQDGSFEEKAQEGLELGVAYLGVENGHIAKIDQHTEYWEAVSSTDPDDGQFPVGLVCDLWKTYCRRTIQQDTSTAVHDAPSQGWSDDPAFEAHELYCYHGTTIKVDDEIYGTVCFVSESPREPFTDGETMFAELIARLLERELERKGHDAELTRQSNLSTVLNRVLRHNLRNSMAVIRGRTEEFATEYPEAPHTQTIIDHTDRLIELGEKARSLQSVMVSNNPRQEVDLQSILDRVVNTVERTYPTASITTDCQEEITVVVRPSLQTALYELIENAAKHTGDSPTVTVSVERVPNGVQIDIIDDGPGLDESELNVLTEGVETALSHGSGLGLWLTYWIVTSHDGTIEATTSPDGTQMTIRLPRQATSTPNSRDTEPTLDRIQNKFRTVFDESSDAMLIANDDGRYVDANQAAGDLFGLSKARLLGRSIEEFAPCGFDFEIAWSEFRDSGNDRGTFPLLRPDGTERIVEYSAESDIVPGQHLTILRDVTERESRNQELQLAETVFENVQDAVFLIDVDDKETFRVERVNEAYERLTGLSNEDIQGKTPSEIVGEEIGAGIESQYSDCVDRKETIQYPETIPVDGEKRHWETKLTPVVEDGTVVKLVGAMRDVTEKKQRQQELELKQMAIEEAPIGISIADATVDDTPLVYVNEAFQSLTGYAADEICGQNCRFLQGEETDLETAETLREAVENEYPVSVDIRNYRADGSAFWNQVTVAPVTNGRDETTHIVGFQQEITTRRAREAELQQLEQGLDSLLSTVPLVFWMTDKHGVFTRSQGKALEAIGLEPNEVVGESVFDVFESHPASCDCARRALDGEAVAETLTLDDVVFNAWFQPLRGNDGEVVGTVGFAAKENKVGQPMETE